MNPRRDEQKRWPWILAFVGFVASLFIVPEVIRMTRPKGPVSIPRIDCYAMAVVLKQHLFAEAKGDTAGMPEYAPELEERFNDMLLYTRGLRRRDDPKAHAMRPIIARAEAARDAAVATDAAAWRAEAWAEVQRCHTLLFAPAAKEAS